MDGKKKKKMYETTAHWAIGTIPLSDAIKIFSLIEATKWNRCIYFAKRFTTNQFNLMFGLYTTMFCKVFCTFFAFFFSILSVLSHSVPWSKFQFYYIQHTAFNVNNIVVCVLCRWKPDIEQRSKQFIDNYCAIAFKTSIKKNNSFLHFCVALNSPV